MQEKVESKTLTLIINGSKLTGRTLKSAMDKYLAHRCQEANCIEDTGKAKRYKQATNQFVVSRFKLN